METKKCSACGKEYSEENVYSIEIIKNMTSESDFFTFWGQMLADIVGESFCAECQEKLAEKYRIILR